MRLSSSELKKRTRTRIAREYRRDGYRVSGPDDTAALPAFLEGYRPDLVAEREDDRVIVEIRTARSLRGDRAFVALAGRVERQVGWRLEFVSVPFFEDVPDPESAHRRFHGVIGDPGFGPPDARTMYLTSVLEVLLIDLARKHGLKAGDLSARRIARELAFRGVLGEAMLADIQDAMALRDEVAHRALDAPAADRAKEEHLTMACERLYELLTLEHAA